MGREGEGEGYDPASLMCQTLSRAWNKCMHKNCRGGGERGYIDIHVQWHLRLCIVLYMVGGDVSFVQLLRLSQNGAQWVHTYHLHSHKHTRICMKITYTLYIYMYMYM